MKLTKQQVIRRIKEHCKVIAKERDALQELIGDAGEILGSCEEAAEDMEHAVATLSKYL